MCNWHLLFGLSSQEVISCDWTNTTFNKTVRGKLKPSFFYIASLNSLLFMKSKISLSINRVACLAALSLAGICPGFAQLAGQYGILDATANGGINPNTGVAWVAGDQYRLAFHTKNTFSADNPNASFYNDLVTDEAQLNPDLVGSTWTAIISTLATNAKDNTGTADQTDGAGIGGAGVPVFAMDGTTCMARNNADIWNGWSNPFDSDAVIRLAANSTNLDSSGNEVTASQNVHYSPFLDQFGLGDTANVHGPTVWTGTRPGGLTHPTQPVGSVVGTPVGSTGTTQTGNTNPNNTSRVWERGNSNNVTSSFAFYALSEPLTIVLADARSFTITIANAVDPEVGFSLEWPAKEGQLYCVRSSATLDAPTSTWTMVAEDISSLENTAVLMVEPAESKLFYIVEEYSTPVAE